MTTSERRAIWLKYDKHCAYCGKLIELKDMQVDHLLPKHLAYWIRNYEISHKYNLPKDINDFENLMPACRRCNYYKGGERLESFRRKIKTLHKRLMEQYLDKVALDYGIITINTWDCKFYFEQHGTTQGSQ